MKRSRQMIVLTKLIAYFLVKTTHVNKSTYTQTLTSIYRKIIIMFYATEIKNEEHSLIS